jgi:hypothetical protein
MSHYILPAYMCVCYLFLFQLISLWKKAIENRNSADELNEVLNDVRNNLAQKLNDSKTTKSWGKNITEVGGGFRFCLHKLSTLINNLLAIIYTPNVQYLYKLSFKSPLSLPEHRCLNTGGDEECFQ